jgi:hypothetical protein
LAEAEPERFAQQRDDLAADRCLRDDLAIFSLFRRHHRVTGHAFAVGGDACLDSDSDIEIDDIDNIH